MPRPNSPGLDEMRGVICMRVLVGCERSGVVRQAFREAGHDAWSCDLVGADDGSPYHIRGDVSPLLLSDEWDLVILHPPCTYLCNSGVRWLHTEQGRYYKMMAAAEFFRQCLAASAVKVCVENPIMHGKALSIVGVKYAQIIQPWQFGHGETKATCLWLRGLPPLIPTDIVSGRDGRIHRLPPGPDRSRLRSVTFAGIARAMAEQWG